MSDSAKVSPRLPATPAHTKHATVTTAIKAAIKQRVLGSAVIISDIIYAYELAPHQFEPAPSPMTAIVFGLFNGRTLPWFFSSTVDAAPIRRMRLADNFMRQCKCRVVV